MKIKKVKLLVATLFFLWLTGLQAQTVKDIDGNVYNTVTIGTQTWMAENLKVTKYNDNTNIPLITNDLVWRDLTTPAYCWYNNDESTYKNTYGALYNWHTVNTGKLCPAGWHVPSDAEWTTLENYLGGRNMGGKLKSTTAWNSPNTGATNSSGFSALPGGYRYKDGAFYGLGASGNWWNSTEHPAVVFQMRLITAGGGYSVYLSHDDVYSNSSALMKKEVGYSVRCLKD